MRLPNVCAICRSFLPKSALTAPDRIRHASASIYQDACHLVHAQGVSQQPRDLLAAVPGIELVEMENPTVCCGAAGLYSVTDTDISLAILEQRLDAIEATGAKVIVSANPGCLLHIQSGARRRGLDLTVMHVAEFLDKAYTT